MSGEIRICLLRRDSIFKMVLQLWVLAAALAAYNAGEGQVNSALFRYGTIDYWVFSDEEVCQRKTIGYVPKIEPQPSLIEPVCVWVSVHREKDEPIDLVRVMVNGGTHIALMAEAAGMDVEQFTQNNPHILSTRLPSDRAEYHVYVPPVLNDFTREMRRMGVDRISSGRSMSEAEIAQYATKEFGLPFPIMPVDLAHTVEEGDTLDLIAAQHLISEASLREWNALGAEANLKEGQIIQLKPAAKAQRSKWVAHDVKKGDL